MSGMLAVSHGTRQCDDLQSASGDALAAGWRTCKEKGQVSESSMSSGQHRTPLSQIKGQTAWTSRNRDLTPGSSFLATS